MTKVLGTPKIIVSQRTHAKLLITWNRKNIILQFFLFSSQLFRLKGNKTKSNIVTVPLGSLSSWFPYVLPHKDVPRSLLDEIKSRRQSKNLVSLISFSVFCPVLLPFHWGGESLWLFALCSSEAGRVHKGITVGDGWPQDGREKRRSL
jgi:hypothetical protein